MGICLCLLFAIFPGYHFSWFLSCEGCVLGVRSDTRRAPLSRGYNQLKLPEMGGEREKCVQRICSPISFLSLSVQFSLCSRNAGKMDASIRPLFFTCAERKSQCFVTELWLHYQHVSKSRLRGMLCGVIIRSIFWLTGAVPKKTTAAVKEGGLLKYYPHPPSPPQSGLQRVTETRFSSLRAEVIRCQ